MAIKYDKKVMFKDFQLLCGLHIPPKNKVVLLTHFFAAITENPWRVVGITENALEVFAKNDFKTKSKIGVNRSHLKNRSETINEMIGRNFQDCNDWWDFFYERDTTILATSTENMTGTFSKIYPIDEKLNLFKSYAFAWTHKNPEINFLKALKKKING